MEFPTGLVFLGTVVMVDRVEHAARLLCGGAEKHGGLAAIGTDLHADAAVEVSAGRRHTGRVPSSAGMEPRTRSDSVNSVFGCSCVGVAHQLKPIVEGRRRFVGPAQRRAGIALPSSLCVFYMSVRSLMLGWRRSSRRPC